MLKYITIIILILVGGLLFINKDKFLSLSATGNEAVAVKSAIGSGSGDTYFNLKLLQQVAHAKKNDPEDGKVRYVSITGFGNIISGKSGKYRSGSVVKIIAKPGYRNQIFWSGACSGSNNTCVVKMNSDKEVVYAFMPTIVKKCRMEGLGIVCDWPGDTGIKY